MNHYSQSPNTNPDGSTPSSLFCLNWSAIIAGALVGLGLGFLLELYGIAIGLSAYHSSPNGAMTIAIGGFIGLLIGTIVSMGLAGFVAGLLDRHENCPCHGGVIYGFLTWALSLLLAVLLMLPFANYVSSYTEALTPNISVSNANPYSIAVTTSSQKNDGTKPQQNIKTTPTTVVGSSWLIFILFFIGAVSSCIGASWGIKHRKNYKKNYK